MLPVRGQVPFQGMVGTVNALGVHEQEPVSMRLCFHVQKPALPIAPIAHGHTKQETITCNMQ